LPPVQELLSLPLINVSLTMILIMAAGIQATSTPVCITVVMEAVTAADTAAITAVADTAVADTAAFTSAVIVVPTAVLTGAVITVNIAVGAGAFIITAIIVQQDIKVTAVLTPAESDYSIDSVFKCQMFCLHKPVPDHVLTVLPRNIFQIRSLQIQSAGKT